MISQPSYQQHRKTDFTSVAISCPETSSLQMIQAVVPFQNGEEPLDVAPFASILPVLGDPFQSHQSFLANSTHVVDDLGHSTQNVNDKGQQA